jgi:hypothetical protein
LSHLFPGRLRTDQIARPLDALLQDEHRRKVSHFTAGVPSSDLADEIELAADFGYSKKDVKRYVRSAGGESLSSSQRSIIGTADLVRELKGLHVLAQYDMAMAGAEPKSWQLVRIAKRSRALRRPVRTLSTGSIV